MKGCRVEIARASRSAGEPECITLALQAFFDLFTDDSRIGEFPPIFIPEEPGQERQMVVPSTHESTLNAMMEELLVRAYGEPQRAMQIRAGHTRLILVRLDNASPRFENLAQIYRKMGIAEVVELEQLPLIFKLVQPADDNQGVSESKYITRPSDLQEVIETSAFPSGAAEIMESLFRNPSLLHATSGFLRKSSGSDGVSPQPNDVWPHQGEAPVRLLFGAFTAGDVGKNEFLHALQTIGIGFHGANSQKWKLLLGEVSVWAESVLTRKAAYQLNPHQRDTLSTYLSGRRILLIEDQLQEQHWNVALPVVFGLQGVLPWRGTLSCPGGPILYHAETVKDALSRLGETICSFDIILLDLFSSEARLTRTRHLKGALLSTIGASVTRLVAALETARDKKAVYPKPFPQLVVFSYEGSGTTVRTILQDFGAADYFIKGAEGEPHKAEFYSSLRNCITNALKRMCMHVTGHAHVCPKQSHFDIWIRQFEPRHRPLVVNLMKHFRYYGAQSIVELFNRYFDAKHANDELGEAFRVTIGNLGIHNVPAQNIWFSYLGRATKSGPATLSLLSKLKALRSLSDGAANLLNAVKAKDTNDKRHVRAFLPQFKSYETLCNDFPDQLVRRGFSHLILVDDVIGSGGQIDAYLKKWINEHLLQECWRKFLPDFLVGKQTKALPPSERDHLWSCFLQEWHKVVSALGSVNQADGVVDQMRVSVVFAVGPENDDLRELIGAAASGDQMLGRIMVPVCSKPSFSAPSEKRLEECHPAQWVVKSHKDGECDCNTTFCVNIHVIEVATSYVVACAETGISVEEMEAMLWEYTRITRPRAKELLCSFEPFGWKDGGGLIATYANTPGNTLPIIWGEQGMRSWVPLWPRFFNPWDDGGGESLECRCTQANRRQICAPGFQAESKDFTRL